MHPYVNIRRRLLQILDSLPPSSLNLSGELFYCFFSQHILFFAPSYKQECWNCQYPRPLWRVSEVWRPLWRNPPKTMRSFALLFQVFHFCDIGRGLYTPSCPKLINKKCWNWQYLGPYDGNPRSLGPYDGYPSTTLRYVDLMFQNFHFLVT